LLEILFQENLKKVVFGENMEKMEKENIVVEKKDFVLVENVKQNQENADMLEK